MTTRNVSFNDTEIELAIRSNGGIYNFYVKYYELTIILILQSIPNLNNILNLKRIFLYRADSNTCIYLYKFLNPNNKNISHLYLSFNTIHNFGYISFVKNYLHDDKPLVFDETFKSEFNIPSFRDFRNISIENNDLRSKIISLFESLCRQSFEVQITSLEEHHKSVHYDNQSNDSDNNVNKKIRIF